MKPKVKQVTSFVLQKLLELGSLPFVIFEGVTTDGGFGRRTLYSAMYGLQKRGYVKKVRRVKQHPLLVLTQKGLLRALLEQCKMAPKSGAWDGKWRIIIFDIPEKKRKYRDFLRQHLGSLGFSRLHKSVWVTPHRIPSQLIQLLWRMRMKIYTRFIVAEHIDYEKDLLRKFRLSTPPDR